MSTNTQKLSGKVAIAAGAAKGSGAAIATHLGAAGPSVVVNYSSSKEGADRVVAAITSKGGQAVAVQANVAQSGYRSALCRIESCVRAHRYSREQRGCVRVR